MVRRGLSLEEKRTKMVEIFTDSMEPYTLKELEKVAPKRKGITPMSVKEVLQSLVDDDLVFTDKCGTQTLYWCLPSAAVQKKRARLAHLNDELADRKAAIGAAKKKKQQLSRGREDTTERNEILERLGTLESELQQLTFRVTLYDTCNPAAVQRLREQAEVCREAANRWTDNLFVLKTFVVDKFGVEPAEFDNNFSVPEQYDYIVEAVTPDGSDQEKKNPAN